MTLPLSTILARVVARIRRQIIWDEQLGTDDLLVLADEIEQAAEVTRLRGEAENRPTFLRAAVNMRRLAAELRDDAPLYRDRPLRREPTLPFAGRQA